MQEQIIQFLKNISIPDYVIISISISFFIVFIFTWIEKIYKAYLWIILWLLIFTLTNLTLDSINQNDIWFTSFKELLSNHREVIWFYSIFFIPLLAILIPLNKNIEFRVSKNKLLNYLSLFFFWLIYFIFLISIFLSIINNKFLFVMDNSIITQIQESYIIKNMFDYFKPSYIFNFLIKYDYIVNLVIILFIFYKMTIWWIVDYFFEKLFKSLWKMFEKKEEKENNEKKEEHS